MKQLSLCQTIVYGVGGILVLAGLVSWPTGKSWAVALYCVGAVAVCVMQFCQRYEGGSIVLRRLRRQQLLGALCLVLTGVLMIVERMHLGVLQHHEWMAVLAVAAMLECYTAFRIPYELKRKD
ncbi:MAG: hypothetical protein PUH21_08855 [Prevotellaceae bacterium]|jgi:phosphatidylglycerophosphate synthase|nr:hypothetical protein [Prevotellaceae bacterium]MDY3856913.1 hypothetical protein [Bacteroidaceae bacterium]